MQRFSLTSGRRGVMDTDSVDLRSRSNKGGRDDSDDEEGSSQPKKQRKPKERKKVTKVLAGFFSPLLCKVLLFYDWAFCCVLFSLSQSDCHLLSKARSSPRPSSRPRNPHLMRMD